MIIRLLIVAAVLASAGIAGAQIGGRTPQDSRRDPMQPPAELFRAQGRAPLRVEVVITSPAGSRALVRLGESGPYTDVAAGDRIGDYRIARIAPHGVVAVLSALGAQNSVTFPLDTTANRP
jgi:hypothetical protein